MQDVGESNALIRGGLAMRHARSVGETSGHIRSLSSLPVMNNKRYIEPFLC
jgi:hypothetical protein